MRYADRFLLIALVTVCVAVMTACSPEVGSEKWCKKMEEKSAADWTAREAKDYAKHCVFK